MSNKWLEYKDIPLMKIKLFDQEYWYIGERGKESKYTLIQGKLDHGQFAVYFGNEEKQIVGILCSGGSNIHLYLREAMKL